MLGILLAIGRGNPIQHVEYLLAGLVVVSGLIMFARIASNAHTPGQVYSGVALGLVVGYVPLFILIY
jgi:membrane-associated phospholipid phosphatase